MLGIYEDNILIDIIESERKISEVLPSIIDDIVSGYEIERLIYVNGPGSYMGIKISYVSFSTLSMVKNIPLYAVSAFELNHNAPVRANKNLCFVKNSNNEISLEKIEEGKFFMPRDLFSLALKEDNTPFYVLEAIN